MGKGRGLSLYALTDISGPFNFRLFVSQDGEIEGSFYARTT